MIWYFYEALLGLELGGGKGFPVWLQLATFSSAFKMVRLWKVQLQSRKNYNNKNVIETRNLEFCRSMNFLPSKIRSFAFFLKMSVCLLVNHCQKALLSGRFLKLHNMCIFSINGYVGVWTSKLEKEARHKHHSGNTSDCFSVVPSLHG